MCGIAGIMSYSGEEPSKRLLQDLTIALRHRGPDGEGHYISGDTALLQTRLAIIDLETGDQPIIMNKGHSSKESALVANGEIYNYIELKKEIGEHFQTKSDCEPLLFMYKKHGLRFAEKIRGMYALAIHDNFHKRLILSRDRFGIKPLYYCFTSSGFIFASEFQAFLRAGIIKPEVRQDAYAELFKFQFTTGHETILKGVFRVLPGETLVLQNGRLKDKVCLQKFSYSHSIKMRDKEAVSKLDEIFENSVSLHQRSDVPYGMFLSGGIDSSSLLAMMKRLNEKPVNTFTIGFSGSNVHDEREHARLIARLMGTKHEEIEFSAEDFWTLLPRVIEAMDDPSADYAILPTFKLAERVKAAGLKVILSGEGADEIFAGYGRYRRELRPRLFRRRGLRSFESSAGLEILRNKVKKKELSFPEGVYKNFEDLTILQRAQAIDIADWLPNDLLTKLDRCLMIHGIEGRVPFLDPELANFGFFLKDTLKLRNSRGKWILRKWLNQRLPEAKAFSKKRGFTVPVGGWIKSKARVLGPLVASQEGIREACNEKAVVSLFKGFSGEDKHLTNIAWVLLYYALWHNYHVLGKRKSGGGVFDILSYT